MTLASEYHELDDLGGRRFRSTISLKPIAYRKDGNLRRIGNVMGATGDAAFPLGVDELCQFRIDPRIAGKSPLVHFGKGQSMVRIALLDANNVAGVVDGNRTYFANAWDGADLAYTIGGHRLQEDILLRVGHPRSVAFRLDSHAGFNPETLEFGSDFRILDPVLEPPAGSDKMAIPLRWLVSQSGGKYILTVHLPDGDWAGWTLDPTLTLQPDAADGQDTEVLNYPGYTTGNFGTSPFLIANNGSYRGLVKFDCSIIPVAATCVGATLFVYKALVESAAAFTVSAYSIAVGNAAWIEGTKNATLAGAGEPCWNALAADGAGGVTTPWAGSAGLSTANTDYETPAIGSFSGNRADAVGTEYSTALTAARVQGWFGTPNTNYGILLVQSVSTVGGLASSDHGTAALRPKLVIYYTVPAAGAVSISPAIGSLMPRGGVRISPVRR